MDDSRAKSGTDADETMALDHNIKVLKPVAVTSTKTPVTSKAPVFDKEVRFAVVMYGGVSLAIYINGVAQELLRLVRSSSSKPYADLKGTERVYRKLNYLLSDKQSNLESAEKEMKADKPVRTRFVVDILSGTSAGGINGIYLAKALANGQDMDELQRLWVKEGDLALLINDKKSIEKPWSVQNPPVSLLNSQRMYVKLLYALANMDGVNLNQAGKRNGGASSQSGAPSADTPDECSSPYVEELDLFVTTTDIQGVPLPVRLADDVVYERRHRNVFHFIYSADGGGSGRNDFMARYNPFLAYAARCTSSFPFAFEPMRLGDIDDVLGGFPHYNGDDRSVADSARWQRFFKDYLNPSGIDSINFPERSFGDGGYLDNKPFTYATETLARRNADVPVDRKLIYIEPSPEHPEDERRTAEKPDFVQNSMAALLTLPRYETIREDLRRVMERNHMVQRLNRIVHGVERDVEVAGRGYTPSASDEAWSRLDLKDMLANKGLGYTGYHRLDIAAVTDDLAQFVARVTSIDDQSDYFLAIRSLIRAWREQTYVEYRTKPNDKTMNEFLWSFNLSYPLRRINFLRAKIDQLHDLDEQSQKVLALRSPGFWPEGTSLSDAQKAEFRKELLVIKTTINDVYDMLRRQVRRLRSSSDKTNPIAEAIKGLAIRPQHLDYILDRTDLTDEMQTLAQLYRETSATDRDPDEFEDECVKRAEFLMTQKREIATGIDELGEKLSAEIKNIRLEADQRCREVLGHEGASANKHENRTKHHPTATTHARTCVEHYYDHFDSYDMITFPIQYGTDMGETDVVEIIRISPEDAKTLINERASGCLKLAGTALGHFGAFLEALWRENDILWGRLDGAERLISSLLPGKPALARKLIADAQAAIVCEAIHGKGGEELSKLLVESMMRTRAGSHDADTLSLFLTNLKGEVTDPDLIAALTGQIDDRALRDYYIKNYPVSSKLKPESSLRSAARATTVIGKMLEGLSDKYQRDLKAAAWVTRLGRIFWGLVEVAVPSSIPNLLVHHWLKLLYFFEALLITAGILFSTTARDLGLKALGVTIAAHMAVLLMTDLMEGKTGKWRKLKMVFVGAIVALMLLGVYEVWKHLGDDLRIWYEQFLKM